MSYEKMMKWNKKHPKGISYKKGWMGFDTSTPGSFTPSMAFLDENYFPYRERCAKAGIEPASCKDYYYNSRKYDEILGQAEKQ